MSHGNVTLDLCSSVFTLDDDDFLSCVNGYTDNDQPHLPYDDRPEVI